MEARIRRLRDLDTGRIVVDRLEVASSFWLRSIGLLGRRALAADGGMWLEPCGSVHTFGLAFSIDLLFLDRDRRALRTVSVLKPWRVAGPVRGARVVVELPAGTLARTGSKVGNRFHLE